MSQSSHHQRSRSIQQIRLEQRLPPLPQLPVSISPITPQIRIQIPDQTVYAPYHDKSDEEDGLPEDEMVGLREGGRRRTMNLAPSPQTPYRDSPSPAAPAIEVSPAASIEANSKPPEYEPMYDYLRTRRTPYTSPNSNAFLSPTSAPQSPVDYMPYRDWIDRPYIITLSPLSPMTRPSPSEPAPPSYEELYRQYSCPQRQGELADLVRQMDSATEWAEEICKFVAGMVILSLCVVGVGLAFNWGRGWGPPNQGRRW